MEEQASGQGSKAGPEMLDARDPAFRENPHARLDDLRARDPVHLDRAHDRVVLTRAADVAAALADATLSSDPFKAAAGTPARRGYTESDRGNRSMLFLDEPDHGRLRRLVTQAFAARAVESLRPRVEALAADLLDGIDPDRPFELIGAYATPLPTLVIAAVLGIEGPDVARFKEWSHDLTALLSTDRSQAAQDRIAAAREGLSAWIATAIAQHRDRPRADLIGALVAAEAQGDRLTEAEIHNTCRLLLAAGNVTTTDLIGNGVVALLAHPVERARLRDEPALWPDAVEEVLRWDPPVVSLNRLAVEAGTIGGCPVAAGQMVTAMLLAANHDPQACPEPHRFDIGRGQRKHHSFGGGGHFCLGASLARLEGQVALSALFARFPGLRLDPARAVARKAQPSFGGYEAIWLRAD